MKLVVQRSRSTDKSTEGSLYADGEFLCHTLEDVVREVPGQPVSSWKVKGSTAIPTGTYRVSLENSPRFGPDTLTLHNVEGFSFIRMHAGNTSEDTEGCLLLGTQVKGGAIVGGTSRPALALVKGKVKEALSAGLPVTIDVR